MSQPETDHVEQYLRDLQNRIRDELQAREPEQPFASDAWTRDGGGGGETRVLEGGEQLERAGVNFSHIRGDSLPPAATRKRPELAGRSFRAMGVSVVVHPRNPHAPTSHLNVRYFVAEHEKDDPVWWFGGGFDLTPYYIDDQDVRHWHTTARDACAPFGEHVYPQLKAWCDGYFQLPHRQEARGVGGLFFDDWDEPDFDGAFALVRSVGDHFLPAYLPVFDRRAGLAYDERERAFQCYRRGRYVEFNLVHDRGTLFGLQSGGRTESILMSMPPEVSWRYDWAPEPGSPEAALTERYLLPRDWLADGN